MGDHARARALIERALKIDEAVYGPDHPAVARDVNNLAGVYRDLGDLATAKGLHARALKIDEAVYGPDHPKVATDVNNLAGVYRALGDLTTAKGLYERALRIAQGAGQPGLSWLVQGNLNSLHAAELRPGLAIFYGKQAVNGLQAQRGRLSDLEKGLQSSFLASVEGYYKGLSDDLLIAQGRLPEAQQVLEMLKQQELFDFVRRDASAAAGTGAASTAFEQEQLARYDAPGRDLAALGRELLALEAVKRFVRTPEQRARIEELQPRIDTAHRAFQASLGQIERAFTEIEGTGRREELAERQIGNDNRGMVREVAAAGGADAVLIHYLVMDARLHILLTTPRVLLARQVDVPTATLNQEIQALRAALQDPRRDPRPAARVLYERLIAPIAADLEGAGAHTLMVSLDEALRYLPLAALHDGTHWLIERYAVSVFTEAARDRVALRPHGDWYQAGLGLSEARPGFGALDAVPGELEGIVTVQTPPPQPSPTRGEGAKNQRLTFLGPPAVGGGLNGYEGIVRRDATDPDGVLPGTIHLNDAFTRAVLSASLHDGYPVVHLARHFVFRPGTEQDSFLLLGDGSRLDLGELRLGDYDFGGVDLLTLSACETAVGGQGAQGREVEGLGALAQRKGAKGVLATLWPVADASTGQLMQTFYRLHGEDKHLTKAAALRQAQLALLQGPDPQRPCGAIRGPVRLSGAGGTGEQPPADPPCRYSHPYYWAPFVLMGNWL